MFRRLGSIAVVGVTVAALLVPTAARAFSPTTYVDMPDGVKIALNIQCPVMPCSASTAPTGGWPIILQIDGYGGASVPMDPCSPTWGGPGGGCPPGVGEWATVHMSLRGTGCSGGQFDLFDRRSSYDGYRVIEWLADPTANPWSSGKIAIWGHSYSGLTGWLVASTQPPHLAAMSVSGLIDDLYRGIVFMGGVSNLGFPLIWTGFYRPFSEYSSGVVPGITAPDAVCAANQAGRVPPDVPDNPILNGVLSLTEDNHWWASHSTITYLDAINVPTHIVQTYQDEQTGPRGSNLLWQRLDERKPSLPKRLILTNGVHSTNTNPPEIRDDRIAFLDCYVRDACTGNYTSPTAQPTNRVTVLFEMHSVTDPGPPSVTYLASNGVLNDPDWPLTVTQWTRYYLLPNGGLTPDVSTVPASADPDSYLAGSKRAGAWTYYPASSGFYNATQSSNLGSDLTNANLPDEVRYSTDAFSTDTAIAGPIDVTLFAASTAPDTEFYVELDDIDAAGNMTRLQRGMLKASHRALDALRTDYNANGDVIRPYHPHTNTLTNLLTPGQAYRYEIEVFPLGHVFRSGHRLMVRVTTPPIADSLAFYIPSTGVGVNRVYHDASHPSSILLPIVPLTGVTLGTALGCGEQVGLERCSNPND